MSKNEIKGQDDDDMSSDDLARESDIDMDDIRVDVDHLDANGNDQINTGLRETTRGESDGENSH